MRLFWISSPQSQLLWPPIYNPDYQRQLAQHRQQGLDLLFALSAEETGLVKPESIPSGALCLGLLFSFGRS
jgi:hypothetical protein